MSSKRLVGAITALIIGAASFGDIGLLIQTPRTMAMGGAGIATARDTEAVIFNPAGLEKTKFNLDVTLFGGINKEILDKKDDFDDVGDEGASDAQRLQDLSDLAPLNVNVHGGGGFELGVGGWALGVMNRSVLNGALASSGASNTTLAYFSLSDTVTFAGKGFDKEFLGKDYRIGVLLKHVNRSFLADSLNQTELLEVASGDRKLSDSYDSADGLGVDVGMQVPVSVPFIGEATAGVAVQNLGLSLSGDNTVDDVPTRVGVGLGFESKFPNIIPVVSTLLSGWTVAVDYYLVSEHDDFDKNLHLGAEKKFFFNRLITRGGINQGFLTYGIGVNLWVLELNYTYFKETIDVDDSFAGEEDVDFHTLSVTVGI